MKNYGSLLRRFLGGMAAQTQGAATVEFAMVLPAMLIGILGIMETGRLVWVQNSLQFAAEEAGRFAMVNATASSAVLTTRVINKLAGVNPDSVTVVVTPDAVGGVNFVRIDATTTFQFLSGLLPVGSITLTGRSRVPQIT